jgi:hypothetical protein
MLGRKEFRRLRRYLKNNPHIIEELIDCSIRHDPSKVYQICEGNNYVPHEEYLKSLHPFAPILYELLHIVVQLGGTSQFQGITRRNAVKFINRCGHYLSPSYETITVQTDIFGQEALRILNHMAFTMLTWH